MSDLVNEIAAPVAEAKWRAFKNWNVWHNTGGLAGNPTQADERLAEATLYAQLKADRAGISPDALTAAVQAIYDRLQAEAFRNAVDKIQEYKAKRAREKASREG
jgi:hypothetical protein